MANVLLSAGFLAYKGGRELTDEGFVPPNYTQSPNQFYDEIMPQITSLAELKVTDVIIRQTFGFHRDESELSISLLMKLTGLSRQAAVDGVTRGMERGTITRRPKAQGFLYRLQLVNDLDHHDSSSQQSRLEPVNDLDGSSQQFRPELVNDLDTYKESKKEKKLKKEEKESLPDWLPTEVWERWKTHRKEIKHPLTPQTIVAQIRQLDNLRGRGQLPESVIEQSIAGGWQGLFELKVDGNSKGRMSNADFSVASGVTAYQRAKEKEDREARENA